MWWALQTNSRARVLGSCGCERKKDESTNLRYNAQVQFATFFRARMAAESSEDYFEDQPLLILQMFLFSVCEEYYWRFLYCERGWLTGRVFSTLPRFPKGTKNHHCTTRVMVEASPHVPLYFLVESTQRVHGVRLILFSARTNKRHHHHSVFKRESVVYWYSI